jgi:hypothetical protein
MPAAQSVGSKPKALVNPWRAEFRTLMVDSALGGIWIAVMQFEPAPERAAGHNAFD